MILLAFALRTAALAASLSPTHRMLLTRCPSAPVELADAIDVEVVEPLFEHDASLRKTKSLYASIAFRESTCSLSARGDHGKSLGAFQELNAPEAIIGDARAQVRGAIKWLSWSVRYCPAFPVSGFARGPRACTNPRAQAISNDRMFVAKEIAASW
jgi:hypothetical protein